MQFRIKFAEQIVGLFTLIAIIALAVILILMGSNQRWFAKNYYFTSRFSSAEGLSKGMAIALKGFEIGKIDTIRLTPINSVEVTFYIYDTYYAKVKRNSVIELTSSPIGLGSNLLFHPGANNDEPLPEFSFIPSVDLEEGKKLIEQGLVDVPQKDDMITVLFDKVEPILNNVNVTLLHMNDLITSATSTIEGNNEGPLGDMLVKADALTGKLDSMITGTTATIQNVSQQIDTLLVKLNRISDNLEQTTSEFRDPTGIVTKMLDPKGSIATLLNDDNALYIQIESVLQGIRATTEQLRTFSVYLNNKAPELSAVIAKSRTALDKGSEVLEGVKNNPLIRGGIVEQKEQLSSFQSYRDEDF